MAAIKPGLMNIFVQRYDKGMVKDYFLKIKNTDYTVKDDTFGRRKSMLRKD